MSANVKDMTTGSPLKLILTFSLPLLYILHVTRSAVQGMGNTVLPMISGIAEFVMRTGGIWILPALMGHDGIFAAEVLADWERI